jgi:ATP-dependent Clp protease ATP-binding subunit ClpA
MAFYNTNFQSFSASLGSPDYEEEDYDEEDEKGPALETYGTDITLLARQGQLEECFGREKELLELMEILVRRQKNNPVLVGDAGVGKTAIIELFASKIVNNLVPFVLEGRSIISLDLARVVAGSRYRGEFELRFQKILDEVLAQPNVIIFIDEIHNIGGTGSAEGSLDAANILKPVLSRSGFQCIGATTTKEYQRIEKDPALNRRFQPIKVVEPSVDDTIKILYGLRSSLEAFHNVEILPGALRLSAELADRYIYDRFLPDKAIDLIDRASAKEVIRLTNVTEGSVVSALANAGLNNMGSLRMEAFRRGDIAAEFVFQEIENAYRNFLLCWIETPLDVPEEPEQVLSPISQELFDEMRMSVLKRVDDLLFSSNQPRSVIRKVRKVKDLSSEKNIEIYNELLDIVKNEDSEVYILSTYRLSVFLFGEWLEGYDFNFITPRFKQKYLIILSDIFEETDMYHYICLARVIIGNDPFYFSSEDDFYEYDAEYYEESFELLSELEEKRVEVFKDFLVELKPILRKGIIQSLKFSSEITLSEKELTTVYNLLGYFSTDTGHRFLCDLESPELIQKARRMGDFTGLKKRITQKEIRELLADMTGIPIQSISSIESHKLINLEATLHKRVIGQEEAISAIAKAIRRSRLGIQNPNRPIASFLFCGPTGVGKTEVTKALAISMFGADTDMIRFDMSEFMEKFSVSRMIGSPPGYVGYEDGGQLTDAVRRKPYSVVLFDEIEKAHPDILNVLLQILEDGRLTDSQKRLVSFENTIIIMTSNAAADEIQQILKTARTGFTLDQPSVTDSKETKGTSSSTSIVKYEYEDEYAGVIEFLRSPITENYLVDLRVEIEDQFEDSFRVVKTSQALAIEVRNAKVSGDDEEQNQEVQSSLKAAVLERLSTMFLPEFLNRLDDIIIFQPLRPEELRRICDIMIKEVGKRVAEKYIVLNVDDKVKLKLTREGYNPAFGARPLRRLVTKYIEDLISENILKVPLTKKSRTLRFQLNENDQIIVTTE